MKKQLIEYLKARGFYQDIVHKNRELEGRLESSKEAIDYRWFANPGHYYSPLIGTADRVEGLLDLNNPKFRHVELNGIRLSPKRQFKLLRELAANTSEIPYQEQGDYLYRYHNDQFGKTDGIVLFLMLRKFRPSKIIEVGSGWSSSLMIDVAKIFKERTSMTFIEPNPERLYDAIKIRGRKNTKIITKKVQDVRVNTFLNLKSGDLLFIDGSHVSKTGSDVNHMLFNVLPSLEKGVIVHIHDILYPFEYPKQWVVDERRNWNEVYAVRAFLIGNSMFEILLWPSFLFATDKNTFLKILPGAKEVAGSIYLKKVS